jgi:hypothetical protein
METPCPLASVITLKRRPEHVYVPINVHLRGAELLVHRDGCRPRDRRCRGRISTEA